MVVNNVGSWFKSLLLGGIIGFKYRNRLNEPIPLMLVSKNGEAPLCESQSADKT